MALNARDTESLKAALQEAIIKCSERCLYQSAKWFVKINVTCFLCSDCNSRAAELLDAIPVDNGDAEAEAEDSQMTEAVEYTNPVISGNVDPAEARLEAREANKFLLAKTFFDCREFDRCAAVFLPDTLLAGIIATAAPKGVQEVNLSGTTAKEKAKTTRPEQGVMLPKLSQKALFLALYAKYMSGEKRKDEDSEMVMGPHDGGQSTNKQLTVISQYLAAWFGERTSDSGDVTGSQGWLEYL